MNFIQKAVSRIFGLPIAYSPMQDGRVLPTTEDIMRQQISMVGGRAVYGETDARKQVERYITMDDVYSVVRRIARTTAMIPMYVYYKKDDTAFKQYTAYRNLLAENKNYTTQSLTQLAKLKSKALTEAPDDDPLAKLICKPNGELTVTEFDTGAIIFHLLTGNTYIYMNILEDGADAGKPSSLHILPSQFTNPIASNTVPQVTLAYQYTINRVNLLTTDAVIHMKYFNPNYDVDGNELVGMSPLRAGGKLLCEIQSQQDYSTGTFQNMGAYGAAWIEDGEQYVDQGQEAVNSLKGHFNAETAGTRNAKKIFFSGSKIGYVAFGIKPVDMELVEAQRFTFSKLCNLFGISDTLFNNDSRSTENNINAMLKQMYTNACLPERYAQRDGYNDKLAPLFNVDGQERYIDVDISAISELQEDIQKMASVYSTLPIMSPRVIKESLKIETTPEDDVWYIKAGYIPMDEVNNPNLDTPITFPDYNSPQNQNNNGNTDNQQPGTQQQDNQPR